MSTRMPNSNRKAHLIVLSVSEFAARAVNSSYLECHDTKWPDVHCGRYLHSPAPVWQGGRGKSVHDLGCSVVDAHTERAHSPCTSEVFFKINLLIFWVLWSYKYFFYIIIIINNFRGDLSDISAKTASLPCTPQICFIISGCNKNTEE